MKLPLCLATSLAGGLLVAAAASAVEVANADGLKFFEAKIRPALVAHCYQCHSADEKIKGGLRLDSRVGSRHGGDSGPAVVPGDLGESLLWTAVNWGDEDYQMPPKKRLPPAVVADLKRWIEMGAPDPRVAEKRVVASAIDIEAGRGFWSFEEPVKTAPPVVADAGWAESDVDRFVLAKLEALGLHPAADAEPETLLRRLYFDLIGMPPSPEEIIRYAGEWKVDPDRAYREKVDELLASERYGERWGRHWLDVARYAESSGRDVNMTFPHAWRYRDYVIDSFNADKPYDRFIMEQIAGDLLEIESDADWQQNLIATGFLAIGTKGLNERDPRQFALDLADEQIDTTSQAFLGLTIACARCHDHKTDPIPTADYYALVGIFQSTKTYFGTVAVATNRRGSKLLELPVAERRSLGRVSLKELGEMRKRIGDVEAQLAEARAQNRRDRGKANAARTVRRLVTTLAQLRSRFESYDGEGFVKTVAMGVQDRERPVEPSVLVRGELDKPAQKVSRGIPQVFARSGSPSRMRSDSSGRLELAKWIASGRNPLTARVVVNRVWGHLFGRGIVSSPDNFGATGMRPTHPALLDHLALRLVGGGWSLKGLIRELVNTRSYRMGSAFDATAYRVDADNELLWRMSPRRLDAESLRDAMLAASGQLDTRRPVGSMVATAGDVVVGRRVSSALFSRPADYRSVYLPVVRDALPEALALFDVADPSLVTGVREETNVPGQALYLMNNSFVIAQAGAMAKRLMAGADTERERFADAFFLCFGRPAREVELAASSAFVQRFQIAAAGAGKSREQVQILALAMFCQSLFASAEFRYLN